MRWLSATISALIRESGAASESTKEAMSLLAVRQRSLVACSGDSGPSVMATSVAPFLRARSLT